MLLGPTAGSQSCAVGDGEMNETKTHQRGGVSWDWINDVSAHCHTSLSRRDSFSFKEICMLYILT